MIKEAIAVTGVGLTILGSIFQPSWAPQPIPLTPGQEYRTGSPLSKPGFFGLFGAIGESVVGGDNFSGGGTAVWDGQRFVDTAQYLGGHSEAVRQASAFFGNEAPQEPSVTVNGQRFPVLSHADAKAAQDSVDWSAAQNGERYPIPNSEPACHRSKAEMMRDAIRLYDEGITSFDCEGNPLPSNAPSQNCPTGQRLFTITVPDEKLGARLIYFCQ